MKCVVEMPHSRSENGLVWICPPSRQNSGSVELTLSYSNPTKTLYNSLQDGKHKQRGVGKHCARIQLYGGPFYLLRHKNGLTCAPVDRDEVDRLRKRFMKLDKVRAEIPKSLQMLIYDMQDNSGTIEREEFLSLPQISSNPLATRYALLPSLSRAALTIPTE